MLKRTDFVSSAKHLLSEARSELNQLISSYPTPIAGCDEQFNHLLGERRRVVDALTALEASAFVPTPRRLTP